MTEFKKLLDLHFLRTFSQKHTLDELELMRKKLTFIVDEKRQKEENEKNRQAQRTALLAKYARQIATEGIDVDELFQALTSKPRHQRSPRPPCYRYVDHNGQERTWNGLGRMPSSLVGKNLRDYLI